MKLTVKQLKRLVREAKPTKKVGASPAYMKKEAVRAAMERMILRRVGDIETEEELRDLFKTLDMALGALKMVPLAAWKKEVENLQMGGATDV